MTDTPVIHRYWEGDRRRDDWTGRVVRGLHPGAEVIDWTPELTAHIAVIDEQVRPEDRIRHRSNCIRYRLLWDFGGIWIDHDIVPLANLFDELPEACTASLRGAREGAVLRFPPHHPYVGALMARIAQRGPSGRRSSEVSGSQLLSTVGGSYPDVAHEPRVFPFDAFGRPLGIPRPIAVHLWTSSGRPPPG